MVASPKHDLTRGPVGAHLRRQATPFALGLVAIFSFEAIDLFFISRLGDAPLAAVGFTLPVIWLIYGIGIGFEAGAASCISRAVGGKDQTLAARLTTDSAVLAALAATALCIIGLVTIQPVFGILGATRELMPLIKDYMGIWYWVAPMDVAMWTCLAAIRARGNTLLESKIFTVAALLNLVLDPIFIFGLFGFPRLEIRGAALATLVANGVMLCFTVWYLHRRLNVFANIIAPFKQILDSWKHLLEIGIPAMVTNAIIPVSSGIVVAMMAVYGVEAVAGFGIAMRVEPMALIPFYALSAVSSPFFGQNFGAGHFDRLLEARRVLTRFCFGFGILLAVGLRLLVAPLASLYTSSPAIHNVAVEYIWLVSWSYGAYGMVMCVNAAFNGSGRPLPAVAISSLRVIFVFLPVAFVGRWLFDLPGLFAASGLANFAIGIFAFAWLGAHIRRGSERSVPISSPPSP